MPRTARDGVTDNRHDEKKANRPAPIEKDCFRDEIRERQSDEQAEERPQAGEHDQRHALRFGLDVAAAGLQHHRRADPAHLHRHEQQPGQRERTAEAEDQQSPQGGPLLRSQRAEIHHQGPEHHQRQARRAA